MSIFDASLGRIKDGKYGLNKGIPHHLNKLEPYMPAINKGTYYLIGADTGSGKTAFVDDLFLYNTFDYYMANKDKMKLNINYFSLEIDSVNKIVKGMVRKLLLDYGINNIDNLNAGNLNIDKQTLNNLLNNLSIDNNYHYDPFNIHLICKTEPHNSIFKKHETIY